MATHEVIGSSVWPPTVAVTTLYVANTHARRLPLTIIELLPEPMTTVHGGNPHAPSQTYEPNN